MHKIHGLLVISCLLVLIGAGCDTSEQSEAALDNLEPTLSEVFAMKVECSEIARNIKEKDQKDENPFVTTLQNHACYSKRLNTCLTFNTHYQARGEMKISKTVEDVLTGKVLEGTGMKNAEELEEGLLEKQIVRYSCSGHEGFASVLNLSSVFFKKIFF